MDLVVIVNVQPVNVGRSPRKHKAILLVDTDAVEAERVSFEFLEMIRWRLAQVSINFRDVHHIHLPLGYRPRVSRHHAPGLGRVQAVEDVLGAAVFEALY
jgi:hypothetical protein